MCYPYKPNHAAFVVDKISTISLALISVAEATSSKVALSRSVLNSSVVPAA